jgi:predicted phage tail protein
MLKLRTKLLLLAIAVFGIAIGALAGIADGAYSAICLFVLPLLVALGGVSIMLDFNSPNAVKTNLASTEVEDAKMDLPRAA